MSKRQFSFLRVLEFPGLKSPKELDIDPSNLEQRDYSAEISFRDVKSLNENICKNSCATTSSKKIHVLDLNAECFYKIKPPSKSKKVRVKFTPIISSVHWDCKRYKILEIKYNTDKSKDGVMPCGKMIEFTVTGSKGTDVLIYHYKIAQEFKIKMEYQSVRS
uniref:Major sperm protein n=1 Tax=Strongyloides venezuelensis TaxID=75913 RepID=A0A0K0FQT9_STRVS